MFLYLYHNEIQNIKQQNREQQKNDSAFSDLMVRKVLGDYVGRQQLEILDDELKNVTIIRDKKGKPYFKGLNNQRPKDRVEVHYSVSHSGNWWGCVMAEEPVGFDLEFCRDKIDYEKIAKRFFTEEEYQFVLSNGLDGFYELWVRKEAYIKYLGSGLAAGLNTFSVIDSRNFSPLVILKEKDDRKTSTCFISACEIWDGVKAAYCCGSGNLIKNSISLE